MAFDVPASRIEYPDGKVDHDVVTDRAVAISPKAGTVTFAASLGTSSGRGVLFVSLDSNSDLVSSLESSVVAPALRNLPVGRDDRPDSAVATNYVIANGPAGADNPERQGLNSALSDPGGQVLDVFDGAPGVLNGELYSPMWDLYVSAWSPDAIAAGRARAIHSELEAQNLAHQGLLTNADGTEPPAASGLISNCPLLMAF